MLKGIEGPVYMGNWLCVPREARNAYLMAASEMSEESGELNAGTNPIRTRVDDLQRTNEKWSLEWKAPMGAQWEKTQRKSWRRCRT